MRLTVKVKLGLAFTVVIMLPMAAAVLGLNTLGALDASMNDVLRGPVERAQLATELYTDLVALSRAERSLILAPTDELAGHYEEEISDSRKVLLARRSRLEAIATEDGKKVLAAFSIASEKYLAAQDRVRGLAQSDKRQASEFTFGAPNLAPHDHATLLTNAN
jgi:methyl-accepting chemotaxis protein